MVLSNIERILNCLDHSRTIIFGKQNKNKKLKHLIDEYHKSRKAFKEIEFFIEFFSPFESKFFINGPLVPKIEMEISNEPFPPHGFQVIEENLFDEGKTDFDKLNKEYDLLSTKFNFLKQHYSTLTIEDQRLEDALKLEMIRIMCLTLNGYDCTINKEALKECAYAIGGIKKTLGFCAQEKPIDELITSLHACEKKLLSGKNSDEFDRLDFMITYLDPSYQKMLLCFNHVQNNGSSSLYYAVDFRQRTFFDHQSINKQYFSVYLTDSSDLEAQARLGKFLFYDPVLSGNNKRACASCHQPAKAFSDGMDKSLHFDQTSRLNRNAPTLVNAAYQKLFFHDGRLFNLEEQAHAVFNNPGEMNTSGDEMVKKIRQSDEYKQLFRNAYRNSFDTIITTYAILKSISEFIKTLDSRDSKFDKYLRGDKKQLTQTEINGYNLFSGKALCGSCHFFPLFNGTVPPMYNDNEFEIIGTAETMQNKSLDKDEGRKKITGSFIHDHAFKTPTLRNIEYTAPYMHNGAYTNLDSVLVFYNKGGGAGLGLQVDNQTLPFDSLGLSKKELNEIKSFLLSLSDTTGLTTKPIALPKFKNSKWNNRKIGGEY